MFSINIMSVFLYLLIVCRDVWSVQQICTNAYRASFLTHNCLLNSRADNENT